MMLLISLKPNRCQPLWASSGGTGPLREASERCRPQSWNANGFLGVGMERCVPGRAQRCVNACMSSEPILDRSFDRSFDRRGLVRAVVAHRQVHACPAWPAQWRRRRRKCRNSLLQWGRSPHRWRCRTLRTTPLCHGAQHRQLVAPDVVASRDFSLGGTLTHLRKDDSVLEHLDSPSAHRGLRGDVIKSPTSARNNPFRSRCLSTHVAPICLQGPSS